MAMTSPVLIMTKSDCSRGDSQPTYAFACSTASAN